MRSKRSKLIPAAAVVVAAFLLVTNPVVADAAHKITGRQIKANTITTSNIKNGTLLMQDIAPGQIPTAPAPSIASVGHFSGPVSTVGPTAIGVFAFAGPQTTLSVAAGQNVVAAGSAALANAGTVSVSVGMCSQPTSGATAPTPLSSTGSYQAVTVTSTRSSYAISTAGSVAPGTYKVGMCVSTGTALSNNDYSIGWAMVASSTTPLGATNVRRR